MRRVHQATTGVVRKFLWGGSEKVVARQAAHMDPTVRAALRTTMQHDTNNNGGDVKQQLQDLEKEIQTAKQALEQAQEREVFLETRYQSYRKALDARAKQLRAEQAAIKKRNNGQVAHHDDDNEEPSRNDLEARLAKWEADEDALQKVRQTHLSILAQCEEMRRTIRELEQKKRHYLELLGENDAFLQVAEQQEQQQGDDGVDLNHDDQDDDDDQDPHQMEEGQRTVPSSTAEASLSDDPDVVLDQDVQQVEQDSEAAAPAAEGSLELVSQQTRQSD